MLYSVDIFLNNNSVNTCDEIHKREELVHTLQAKLEALPVYTYTVILICDMCMTKGTSCCIYVFERKSILLVKRWRLLIFSIEAEI